MKSLLSWAAVIVLSSSATAQAKPGSDGLTWARLGRPVIVDGPRVTPLRVLEDSRCPMEARCVWAGQVRLEVRIGSGRRSVVREIVSNKPLAVADGTLELAAVMPPKSTEHANRRGDYRFGFSFVGGL